MTQFDVDGDSRPLLDRVLAHDSRVRSRPTTQDNDALDVGERLRIKSVNVDDTVFDAPANGVGNGLGLFADFFRHERRPTALRGS